MILRSLNIIKFIILIIFIIASLILIFKGFNSLKNGFFSKQNENKINIRDITFTKEENKINSQKQKPNKNLAINKNLSSENKFEEKIIIVKKNDTFSKIINPFFEKKIKQLIILKIKKKLNLKKLNIGQQIFLYNDSNKIIRKIVLPISINKDLVVEIKSDTVEIFEQNIITDTEINSIKFVILSSLYKDGIEAGIPLSILTDAIKLYSFDIDFQRDIKKDTKFEISYETILNTQRQNIEYGKIKYINLKFKNKDLEYFIFKTEDGYDEYFNREGKNIKKSLLKTPIDGARLSSNFGMRKHPISGYNKLHKGVDFAAPKGTPVYAGGNGVIEFIGRNGSYGKYIRIRHNNEYKTAYGHLSNYKKEIYKGVRVNQGDIIGYVGNTGNSTGPHLHYEIFYKNKQIDPMKLKLPSGIILSGINLKKFKKEIKDIYAKHLFTLYE